MPTVPRPTRPKRPSLRAPRPPIRLAVILGAIFAVVVFFPWIANLYVDAKWFASLGQGALWTTSFTTRVTLGLAGAAIAAVVLFVNLRLALARGATLGGLKIGAQAIGTINVDLRPVLGRIGAVVVGVLAMLFGIAASSGWAVWLMSRHGVDFGQRDPLFGLDAAFYVFRLPFLEGLAVYARWLVGITLAGTGAIYALLGGVQLEPTGPTLHVLARRHLGALAALFFIVLGFDAWLDTYALLSATDGPVHGASYVDVNVRLPAFRALALVSFLAAGVTFAAARRGERLWFFGAIGLYVLVHVVGVRAIPSLVHQYSVVPNELSLESPYIQRNIAATRFAYALNAVKVRDLAPDASLSRESIVRNEGVIENIRLWDHKQLLETFAEIQEIRPYYEFHSVDNDRYVIDGRLRQVMLSAREMNTATLPNRRWVTEHFVYTHGYGLALGPVNTANEQGLPLLFVKDIPPTASTTGVQVKRPAIYFGEMFDDEDYAFVRTKHKEFDYPAEKDVYSVYSGSAGIPVDSSFMKLALSTVVGSLNPVLAKDLAAGSRVLLHRNVADRVRRLFPFLELDSDPYIVVRDNGELVWIQDAYTTSSSFPYAQRTSLGVNYLRNSVKVVIDAFDGTVDAYVTDPKDPVIRAWASVFPGAFRELEGMPKDVRGHLRYPEDIFRVQSEMLAIYHMDQPEQLYNREDAWEIPAITREGQPALMEPYYTIMRLPDEPSAEFIQMLPFTPKGKNNLAAWLVSRMDGGKLGELIAYRFPKDRLVFGPDQVMSRINQDAEISRQITLWNDTNSQTILGTLLVMPVEESIIYIVPLYLQAKGGKLPELKRVIVSYESLMVMEPNLDAALEKLFPRGEGEGPKVVTSGKVLAPNVTPTTSEVPSTDLQRIAGAARAAFERAERSSQQGDWAAYGEALKDLRAELEKLAPASKAAKPAKKAAAPAPQ